MLSKKFGFLFEAGVLPKIVSKALEYYGLKEMPGKKSNETILKMAKDLTVESIYKNDDTAWCALFICWVLIQCGKPLPSTKGDKYNFLRARWLLGYGELVPEGEEMLGDLLIFSRGGSGHVGIYIAESDTTFFVLGGNQNNKVSITEIAKSRLIGARRYYRTAAPESVKKYLLDSEGNVSTNEA